MAPPADPAALATLHAGVRELVAATARLAAKVPPPWAALLAGAGVLFLLHGARRRHVLALPGGALLGLAAARLLVLALDGPGGSVQGELLWIAAGVGAFACAAWPPLFPILGVAVPSLVAGWMLPIAGRPWLGALAAAAAGGLVGAVLREWVACVAAGGIGAAALLAGVMGLLGGRPAAEELAAHPMVLAAAWAVLLVAGAAFHAGRAWPPDRGRKGGSGIEPMDAGPRAAAGADRPG